MRFILIANFFYAKPTEATVGLDLPEMVRLINTERSNRGLRSLKLNDKLNMISQSHSNYQAKIKKLTHNGPNGEQAWDRALDAGYDYEYVSENIAYMKGSTKMLVNFLMKSNGTASLLMKKELVDFGAGMTDYYWTQTMGIPI